MDRGDDPLVGRLLDGRYSLVRRVARGGTATVMLDAARGVPGLVRVAGAGPMQPLVNASAAAGDITALGALSADDVRRELGAAVAVLVPSLWFEGFPMVVLEANAVGTPVIASRIGSLAEIIEDGVTGVLVDPNDSEALGRAMRWAADHPDEMRALGATARARYEARYRGATHLESLLAVYRRSRTSGAADA